jgi:hypothetical protein
MKEWNVALINEMYVLAIYDQMKVYETFEYVDAYAKVVSGATLLPNRAVALHGGCSFNILGLTKA